MPWKVILAIPFEKTIHRRGLDLQAVVRRCSLKSGALKKLTNFTGKQLLEPFLNFSLYFTSYLSIALSKILPHSKTLKNAENLSVFGENNSRRCFNFLQTHIFWNFDHISGIYNQINYRNIWFLKVIMILIMTAQVLFSTIFRKRPAP